MASNERKELIAWLENRSRCPMPGAARMYKLTLDTIMAKPANDPLTLEQLRDLPLKDWVWIDFIGVPELYKSKPDDAYFQKQKTWCGSDDFGCGYPGLQHNFAFAEYGVTWLAYHSQPERSKSE